MAGHPTSRLAISVNAVRSAASSAPTSRADKASMHHVVRRRTGLVHRGFPLGNNLAPVGVVPRDRERAVPASPVILRSRGAMIVNRISFIIVVMTRDGGHGPQCTD
eukprot:95098-Pyramimonas_sp.AAC.1